MAQQPSIPLTLEHQCINALVEQIIRDQRPIDSIDNLLLPPFLIARIKWIYDLSVFPGSISPNLAPFSTLDAGRIRWTLVDGSVKIDRRTTAADLLANLGPGTCTSTVIEAGFVLACTYCLEDEIRRLWPFCRPNIFSTERNPATVGYWTGILEGRSFDYLPRILTAPGGSSDFWLTVVQSFWSIVLRKYGGLSQHWLGGILKYAVRFGHRSIVEFVRPHLTEVAYDRFGQGEEDAIEFLKWAIREDYFEFFVQIWSWCVNQCFSRSVFSSIIDEVRIGSERSEVGKRIAEDLWHSVVTNRVTEFAPINEELCRVLSTLWSSRPTTKREEFFGDFVDLISRAFEFGYGATYFPRFVSDFEALCRTFRTACERGYLRLVVVVWKQTSSEQHYVMIGGRGGASLATAARNGHLSILRYLWENMDQQTAYQSIVCDGISRDSLSQLIVSFSGKADGTTHELEDFFASLITRASDGREPIYPLAPMKEMVVAALLLNEAEACKVLLRRSECRGDPTVLATLFGNFNDDQKIRLVSKMTEDEAKLHGLGGMMKIRAGMDEDEMKMDVEEEGAEEQEDEEMEGAFLDLFDEYYEN